MDEVGFIISHIEKGRIYVYEIGHPQIAGVVGEEVIIRGRKGTIQGIITTQTVNNFRDRKEDNKVRIEDIYIDTGYSSEELVKYGVEVGSFVSFDRKTKLLGSDLIIGKALDDRFGCFIILELIDQLRSGHIQCPNNLLFLFTVREELLQKGYLNSIDQWRVDMILSLDTINAREKFDDTKSNTNIRCVGDGPLIMVYNRAGLTDPQLNNFIRDTADRSNIRLQIGMQLTGDTDVHRLQPVIPHTVPAAILSIVVRNVHTPFSIASLNDISDLLRLFQLIIAIKF